MDRPMPTLLYFIFSHPDFTVGMGVSPNRLLIFKSSQTLTVGMEFHQSPKILFNIIIFFPKYLRKHFIRFFFAKAGTKKRKRAAALVQQPSFIV
jgi:hypothetical protein